MSTEKQGNKPDQPNKL